LPTHPFARPRGRIEVIEVHSEALKNNLLGDPTDRSIAVYLPEGYDQTTDDYPLMVDIVGFTGSGFGHVGWKAFQENVPQQVDRLIASGAMGPVIVAFPDCFTTLGPAFAGAQRTDRNIYIKRNPKKDHKGARTSATPQ